MICELLRGKRSEILMVVNVMNSLSGDVRQTPLEEVWEGEQSALL
jgi:hypothetical protein